MAWRLALNDPGGSTPPLLQRDEPIDLNVNGAARPCCHKEDAAALGSAPALRHGPSLSLGSPMPLRERASHPSAWQDAQLLPG